MVRIDLLRGKFEAHRQAIGDAIYQALVSVGVPEDDRFQVIAEHAPRVVVHVLTSKLVVPRKPQGIHFANQLNTVRIS
jgi:hypothetical protein